MSSRLTVDDINAAEPRLLIDGEPAELSLSELAAVIWPEPRPPVATKDFLDAMLQVAIHLDQSFDAVSAMSIEDALPRPLRLAFVLAADAVEDFANGLVMLDAPSSADRPTAERLRELICNVARAEAAVFKELGAAREALVAAVSKGSVP